MKKIVAALFFSAGFSLNAEPNPELMINVMSSGPWESTFAEHLYRITFTEEKYEMTLVGPGGTSCSASYTTNGEKIQLGAGPEFCKKQVCTIIFPKESIEGNRALKCGKTLYYPEGSRVEKDTAVKINGTPAIAMGYAPGSTTTKVVIRSGPSKSSKAVACTGTVPDTLNLIILARTSQKVKVDAWNNYWYYVLIQGDENSFDCGRRPQWIFGEFVKVQ